MNTGHHTFVCSSQSVNCPFVASHDTILPSMIASAHLVTYSRASLQISSFSTPMKAQYVVVRSFISGTMHAKYTSNSSFAIDHAMLVSGYASFSALYVHTEKTTFQPDDRLFERVCTMLCTTCRIISRVSALGVREMMYSNGRMNAFWKL